MYFATSIVSLLAFAASSLAAISGSSTSRQNNNHHLESRSSRVTCLPHVHGRLFQVQSQKQPNYYWTLNNCINVGCTTLTLQYNSRSSYNKFYAGTKKTGSTPPYEISPYANPGGFCINAPVRSGVVRGADCEKNKASEQFRFECTVCNDSPKRDTVIGKDCQAIAVATSQCVVGHGLSNELTLGKCDPTNKAQLFNVIVN
ncbi:hypothetical protein T439DRAFT_329886 [Meredithblackwellia eburnea MCA 4105]